MKRRLIVWVTALALLVIPVTLLVWGFLLPCQYEDTFLGELKYKCRLLEQTEGRRIVFVGGSGVAFGVDSALVERELPGYRAVNFGLYADLGTGVMLELCEDSLRPGDVVILMPEQQAQALSGWFGADSFWQGADGAFSLLARLDRSHWGALAGAFPAFAAAKLRYALTAPPAGSGVYARGAFDRRGDIVSPVCSQNVMPVGWDANQPIRFQPDMVSEDFAETVRDWAGRLARRGVTLWYHFCPMNALAVEDAAALDAYCGALESALRVPVAGDPADAILDGQWFYDTNFHLNRSGKTVFTHQLIRDIKAMLGDSTPTEIDLPEPPPLAEPTQAGDNTDSGCFTYVLQNGEAVLTGLTEQGLNRTTLTLPGSYEGCPVRRLPAGVLSGAVETVRVPANIAAIEDGAFSACPGLRSIVMQSEQPESCRVGQNLLEGTRAAILVPPSALDRYRLSYFWSVYAARIAGQAEGR